MGTVIFQLFRPASAGVGGKGAAARTIFDAVASIAALPELLATDSPEMEPSDRIVNVTHNFPFAGEGIRPSARDSVLLTRPR